MAVIDAERRDERGKKIVLRKHSHSKSPESETTMVPVCLSWSREVVMMMVKKKERQLLVLLSVDDR